LTEIKARSDSDEVKLLEAERGRQSEMRDRKKRKIVEDITYLEMNKLNLLKTGVYTPDGIIEEAIKLKGQLLQIQIDEENSTISIAKTTENLITLSELLKTFHLLYENANPDEKEPIIRMSFPNSIFSKVTLYINVNQDFAH
jgi:hypothetical protein